MIFITGANGWLGLNLIESIINRETEEWGFKKQRIKCFIKKGSEKNKILKIYNDIDIFEGDITIEKDISSFLSECKNGILIHTAGVIHPKNSKEFDIINHLSTLNLVNIAHQKKIKKVIIISSNSPCGCNLSNDKKYAFDEKSPYKPYMNYGKSKMIMEKQINNKFRVTNLDYTIIRAPWFYGPHQPERQKLFFEMIKNGKGPIIGDGNNLRSMVYMKNLVQGISLCIANKVSFQKTYWIADKEPYSMNQIIDTIESILIEKFNVDCKMKRLKLPSIISNIAEKTDFILQLMGFYNQKIHVLSEMNKNIFCSVEKAVEEIGYNPKYELKKGMENSLNEIYY